MFDMQVLLSEMQKSCPRCKVFVSRVAKPECRTTIFTGQPALFASRVAKPECRTTIFTGRPDRLPYYCFTISFPFGSRSPRVFLHLGQRNLNVEPPFSPVGRQFLHLGYRNLNVEPPFSPVGRTVYYITILLFHFHSVPNKGFCISGSET